MKYPQIYAKAANGEPELRDMNGRERLNHAFQEKVLSRVMAPFVIAGTLFHAATGHPKSFGLDPE